MSSKALPSLLAASLLTSLLTAGCYTVLKHPPSADLVDEERGTRRECYDCHDGADAYHFQDPFSLYYYDYYSPLWYPYYARPWWYSDFWYPTTGEDVPSDVETGGRHGWTRPTPTGRNPEAPPAVGTVPPVPSTGSAPPKEADESKPEKKKEDEGRHQWTRGSAKGDRK